MTYSYFLTQFILVVHFGKFPNVKKLGSAPEINFLADIRAELKRRLLDTIKKVCKNVLIFLLSLLTFYFVLNKNKILTLKNRREYKVNLRMATKKIT